MTVAATGSSQSDAALIQSSMAIVTGADGTKGVVLLGGVEGDEVWVVNDSSSTLKVYPPSGAAISVPGTGLGSANAAFLVTGNATFHGKFESTTQIIASSTVAYAQGDAGTLTVTFATPGTSAFVSTENNYTYTKVGREVIFRFNVVGTITIGTGSGVLKLTGVPFTNANVTSNYAVGSVLWGDAITKAGYTQIVPVIIPNSAAVQFAWCGSGSAVADVTAADITTGSTLRLRGSLTFHI